MTAAIDTSGEQHRRECEARDWLRKGHADVASVDKLMDAIAKRRGEAAAYFLRQEMRVQWKRRAEWIGVET